MDIRSEIKKEMKTVLENFEVEIKKIRTGRASLTLFEGLKVEYYGDLVPSTRWRLWPSPPPTW